MADPHDISSYSPEDRRVIEDLVRNQTAHFIQKCDQLCELYRVVTPEGVHDDDAFSSLIQYKVLAQAGGNLLAEVIKRGGKPTDILQLINYHTREMIVIALREAGVKAPKGLSVAMEKANQIKGDK